MPRPCTCEHVTNPGGERAEGDCYLCWLYHSPRGERYRRLWDAPEPPGWLQRAAHFGAAVAAHVADGLAKRTPEEIDALYETHCKPCPQFVGEVCSRCGCGVHKRRRIWLNKLAWRSEHCPEGKW